MKLVSKMLVFVILSVVIMSSFVIKAHAYRRVGTEVLTPTTTKYYRHIETNNYGEQHQILQVVVETNKFFFRTLTGCELFRIDIYELSKDQTFESVAGNFSNGGCVLKTTIDCDQKAVDLPQGNYIFRIVTYGNQENNVFTMVFGPPVPTK